MSSKTVGVWETKKLEKLRAHQTKGILAQRRNTRTQAHGH